MTTKNKKKVGRPAEYNWSKVNLLWKNKTDPEIARFLGCTTPNVRAKRQRLIASASETKKPNYICTRKKWSRGKSKA